jgi:putative DNA primase/helicase
MTDSLASEQRRSVAADGAKRRLKAVTRTAMEVTPRQVKWLMPGLIPFGALTVLAGQPGLGKSLLTVKIAADFSAGRLPDRGDVLMLTAEDPFAEVVVPRLTAARAKLTSIHFAELEEAYMAMPLRLPTDIETLNEIVREYSARLVVIDPLSAHLTSGVDSFKDQSVREALAPLAALAETRQLAIVLVAHLNKGQSTDPLQRLGGSIGLPAAARSVLLMGRDPDDPEGASGSRRVLAHVKSNFGQLAGSEAYRIESTTVQSWLEEMAVAHIVEAGPSPYRGADLLVAGHEADQPSVMQEAIAFLKTVLADGPRAASEVEDQAAQAALPWDTVKRAKRRAGVTTRKERGVANGRWMWQLVEQPSATEMPAA